jgi:hypothetical protein
MARVWPEGAASSFPAALVDRAPLVDPLAVDPEARLLASLDQFSAQLADLAGSGRGVVVRAALMMLAGVLPVPPVLLRIL